MLSPPTLNPLNYKALSCNAEVPPAFNESLAPYSIYGSPLNMENSMPPI